MAGCPIRVQSSSRSVFLCFIISSSLADTLRVIWSTRRKLACVVRVLRMSAMMEENNNPVMSKKAAAKAAKKAGKTLSKQNGSGCTRCGRGEGGSSLGCQLWRREQSLQSKEISRRKWLAVRSLDTAMQGHTVLVRGRVHAVRGTGKMAFLVVRKPAALCSVCCRSQQT